MSFPQYRKYKGINTYFKILSKTEFVEVSFIGNSKQMIQITATQYPEILKIQDMLSGDESVYEKISEDEYNVYCG